MIESPPPLPAKDRIQELLCDAARLGRADMIAALVQAGADVEKHDAQGYTPLILASYNGHFNATRDLLTFGASVDLPDLGRGNTALMGCAFKGHDEIAAMLIDARADVDYRNPAGQTAIMLAAMFARDVIVDYLLDAGADPAFVDAAGNSAASVAAAQNNSALAERLSLAIDGSGIAAQKAMFRIAR